MVHTGRGGPFIALHDNSDSKEVTNLSQCCFLTLGLITIIGLGLLPNVIAQAKVEKGFAHENATTLNAKGVALGKLSNYNGAIGYFDKVLAIDPFAVAALNNKGLALDNLGNHTGAIQYYDKALAIDPKFELALNNKGVAVSKLGR